MHVDPEVPGSINLAKAVYARLGRRRRRMRAIENRLSAWVYLLSPASVAVFLVRLGYEFLDWKWIACVLAANCAIYTALCVVAGIRIRIDEHLSDIKAQLN